MSDEVVIITKNSIFTVALNKKQLALSHAGMTNLPTNIGKLTELTELDVYKNKLTNLPKSIGNLRNLLSLDAGHNKLNSLPESIGNLKNLKLLDLDDTQLTALPESIGGLTKLVSLDLANTKITSLPESFGNLKNLVLLNLRGVSLRSLPNSFKNLNPTLKIAIGSDIVYSKNELLRKFRPYKPKRITKNTELFNACMIPTNKISNIPKNKRAYININSNVKNNGKLRRLYNKSSVNEYMRDRPIGRIHGGNFTKNNVKTIRPTNSVNKNVYLRNIKNRLRNVSLNNFNSTVNKIKANLPTNVSRTDVNNQIRLLKPEILKKILNKLKNSPPDNRNRIMNAMKRQGLMNQSNMDTMKKNL